MMRLKQTLLYAIGIMLLTGGFNSGNAQQLPTTDPEKAGLSASRLNRISELITKHVDSGELSGAVALVARKGEVAFFESFGQIDIGSKKPMPVDAIFRIASMTKLFTSVAVMILYEEGHFAFYDPVSKYIPEVANMQVAEFDESKKLLNTNPAKSEITIRDLLRHTAGFTYSSDYGQLDKMYQQAGLNASSSEPYIGSLQSFVKTISDLPLAFEPASKWEYSYSYDVLGYLIEVVSGQSLEKYINDRIFTKLGLTSSGFTISDDQLDRFPNLYNFKNGELELYESASNSRFKKMPEALSGGGGWIDTGYGGMVTSTMDFAILLQMLLNKGQYQGVDILNQKTVEMMLRDNLMDIPNNWLGPGVGFGLCSAVLVDPAKAEKIGSAGQFWWAGSCNTYFFVDPSEEMIGIVMTQMLPFGHLGLMGKFKQLCQQSIMR